MKKLALFFTAKLSQAVVVVAIASCDRNHPEPSPTKEPVLVITGFSPNSGLVGSSVAIFGDQFIPTVAPANGVGPYANTSVVSFNGTVAKADYVYQDSIGKQHINIKVPAGATSGKITVTAKGNTVSSVEDFSINIPVYLPNVQVTTVPGWGQDIDIDREGSLYVTHTGPYEISKITADGNVHTLWSSMTSEVPWGIAVDANGNVFATVDQHVLKISADGTVTTFAGGSEGGYENGQGSSARFRIPLGIDVDKDGNVYVADVDNYKIRKITPDGTVSTLAGSTQGFNDGTGSNALFDRPTNLTLDAEGNVFVADGMRIRKVTSSGQVSTVAGSASRYGYLDGTTANAQFNDPNGIVTDDAGNLYVCDTNNFVVRRIAPDGAVVTVAGSTAGDLDGAGSSALFGYTLGITMDENGVIYLTQGGGPNKIRKIVIN